MRLITANSLCILAISVGWTSGTVLVVPPRGLGDAAAADPDNGLVIEDLYRQLANIDPSYFRDREDVDGDERDYIGEAGLPGEELEEEAAMVRGAPGDVDDGEENWVKSIPRSPVAGGRTDIRDSEYIGHSSNAATNGFIYMSGLYNAYKLMSQLFIDTVFRVELTRYRLFQCRYDVDQISRYRHYIDICVTRVTISPMRMVAKGLSENYRSK